MPNTSRIRGKQAAPAPRVYGARRGRDGLTKERRSWNMSRIRGKDTTPEKRVSSLLHRRGYRFRLHVRTLPEYETQVREKRCSTSRVQHLVVQFAGVRALLCIRIARARRCLTGTETRRSITRFLTLAAPSGAGANHALRPSGAPPVVSPHLRGRKSETVGTAAPPQTNAKQIGRASCRERV